MISGITYKENFIIEPDGLFERLVNAVSWDERMTARKTASFGKAYNYYRDSNGETRSLKFRNIAEPEQFLTYELPSGSLVYMTQAVQAYWQHAIPKSDTDNGRISLTFRKIK